MLIQISLKTLDQIQGNLIYFCSSFKAVAVESVHFQILKKIFCDVIDLMCLKTDQKKHPEDRVHTLEVSFWQFTRHGNETVLQVLKA